jgi:hypothetical protein
VEAKRLETEEAIKLRTEDMNRAVQERQFTVTKEKQRLEEEAKQEGEEARVRRERAVSLSEMDKQVKVAEAAVDVERKRAIVVAEQKAVVEQEEEKNTIAARMVAEREREVALIDADKNAKKEQVVKVVAAEAQKEADRHSAEAEKIKVISAAEGARDAALRDAERLQTTADAEAKAADKKRHAMEQEAEGLAAKEAAPGLAEAKVITAKATAEKTAGLANAEVITAKGNAEASVTQTLAEAEAEGIKDKELAAAAGIEARGLAEAKGIEEKAKAMKLLHEAGQSHEEFRLRLAKERDVELASIEVEKSIAASNASVIGEALKSAKIDIVGGENDFFEKVVRAVGMGKSVDRLVSNSRTLTDVKNTLFGGDPEKFKNQLRSWVKDYGVSSEDVKNLSVAALLTKLMATSKDSGTQTMLESAKAFAREAGLADAPAESTIKPAKA